MKRVFVLLLFFLMIFTFVSYSAVQIQLRHDTAANWTTNDPTLALGEVGLETDTRKMKIGDGSTAWTALNYTAGGAGGQLTQEEVEDYAGEMVANATGTHTRVTLTYQDATGDMDIVVDDMNDDVPEAGDFGAATDLDANGALVANAVDSAEYTDASIDHEHLAPDAISGMTDVTSADADYIMLWDATDSTLKKCDMGEVRGVLSGNCSVNRPTAQTIGTSYTLVQYNVEAWDELNEWDSTTNYRFTANSDGVYWFCCRLSWAVNAAAGQYAFAIYKNGSYCKFNFYYLYTAGYPSVTLTGLIELDANDYLEAKGRGVSSHNSYADAAAVYWDIQKFY